MTLLGIKNLEQLKNARNYTDKLPEASNGLKNLPPVGKSIFWCLQGEICSF